MKKITIIIVTLMFVVLLIGCGEDTVEHKLEYPSKPNHGNSVSVHDPSVIYDDGMYYAFGSHFAVARTTNLITWYQVTGDNNSSQLFGQNWRETLKDAVEHVGTGASSTWAPGMVKIGDKFYMYYSLSTFGSQKSYIGRVESNHILGPYTNSVEIVKSEPSNGPNAIDAEVFFDKDGRLWMVYGSFFGGIYIKELHASGDEVGLPIEPGYGTKIWNGYDAGPEGPYIFYNEDAGYYYLMVSHGSLSSNYNMRVARSKTPDGPYIDVRNTDTALSSNSGIKLAGNYQFDGGQGLAALGHNSVIEVGGKYFVVYHTRFRQGQSTVSNQHSLYTNQLLFNEDGWPVLVPARYAGETLQIIHESNIPGKYNVLLHSGGNSEAFVAPSVYTLLKNGEIEEGGTWEFVGPYYINIHIGIKTYHGIFITTFDSAQEQPTLSISAISYPDGMSLWANKIV